MKLFLVQQIVLLLLLTVVIFSVADVNDDEKFLNEVITISNFYGKPFTGTYRELRKKEHERYCNGRINVNDCIISKEKTAWDCKWENGICVPGVVSPLDDDPPPKNNGKKKQQKNEKRKKKNGGKKWYNKFF